MGVRGGGKISYLGDGSSLRLGGGGLVWLVLGSGVGGGGGGVAGRAAGVVGVVGSGSVGALGCSSIVWMGVG